MPKLEVTRLELNALIDAVMLTRADQNLTPELSELYSELHVKLETCLELWINGGEIELEVPPEFRKIGVSKWTKVLPPHDEGCARHGE